MPYQFSLHRYTTLALAVAVLLVLGGYLFGERAVTLVDAIGEPNLAQYADEVVAACANEEYKPSCYDEEIPRLMDELTMEEAFAVTRIVQDRDQSYYYCHVLGHNISAREASKDLSQWTDVIGRCPLGMCSNGCLHGTFQERFRDAEELSREKVQDTLPQLRSICEDSDSRTFTGLERASCFHALGHLSMYITAADITRATDLCDAMTAQGRLGFRDVCYDGAFMQIFQPLEPEDFALIEDIEPQTPQEATRFCEQFTGSRYSSCHRESWPHFREELEASAQGIVDFCTRARTPMNEDRCYLGMLYVLTPNLDFDVERVANYCSGMPDERKGICFGSAASRFVETDYRLAEDASALCARGTEYGAGDACYRELLFYSTYNYHPGSAEFVQLCEALPGEWQERCMNEEGYNVRPFGSAYRAGN